MLQKNRPSLPADMGPTEPIAYVKRSAGTDKELTAPGDGLESIGASKEVGESTPNKMGDPVDRINSTNTGNYAPILS